MQILILKEDIAKQIFKNFSLKDIRTLYEYTQDFIKPNMKIYGFKKKSDYENLFIKLFKSNKFTSRFLNKLYSTPTSKYLYNTLVWEKQKIDFEEIDQKYKFKNIKAIDSGTSILPDELSLIYKFSQDFFQTENILYIQRDIRSILKYVLPAPRDFFLHEIKNPPPTKYSYNNENGVLNFINTIEDMLKNNLVEFGKTNEKPLAKTLNILKSASISKEFYSQKKLDSFATDMLTRSFYFYYLASKSFKPKEQDTLKEFVLNQLDDRYYFFITRIFLSHLKKVRFDPYYTSQRELFEVLKMLLPQFPTENYLSIDNILNFFKYREIRIDLESSYKTDDYYMKCDIEEETRIIIENLYVRSGYEILFLEPLIKASMFYFGALGVLELKYEDPISSYNISANDKPYISPWDSLEYVKLTKLGKYVLNLSNNYEYKEVKTGKKEIKFDEYKPVITVDKQDTIMQAKLESYAEKYDENRYILSYSKIFKDCKNKKALELKIEGFYKQIEPNPPKIFKDFFDEILKNSNLLKRNLKQVVIELKNNKKLLNLFMKNKKLQDLIIKAQGYRIIVFKEDIPKLTKIVKDNGFFVEF